MAEASSDGLYRVRVEGEGGVRAAVPVRAGSEAEAAAILRSRGARVLGVEPMDASAARNPHDGPKARLSCTRCGYTLTGLVESPARVVVCPECGSANTPVDPASAPVRGPTVGARVAWLVAAVLLTGLVVHLAKSWLR